MRNLRVLDGYRLIEEAKKMWGWVGDETCGAFMIPHKATGVDLRVIASSGEGWDHVSVSLPGRCPNWPEMEYVKRLFFKDSEAAMQLHVPPDDHINCHPNCLHLWRPLKGEIPRPPAILVGPKTRGAT